MTDEEAAKLRAEFPAECVGKLPKISCRNCTDSRGKVCDEHRKQKCQVCGNYLTTAHVDLDFVGHADVTDRLLSVDPEWSWEPMARTPEGLPMLDRSGGLWINLTVCGVTRPGYGDGPDPKQLIGDALRNAAMRFGVALDLWAKGKLESEVDAQHAERKPVPLTAPQAKQALVKAAGKCDDPKAVASAAWEKFGFEGQTEFTDDDLEPAFDFIRSSK